METLQAIRERRSIKRLVEPGPTDADLRTMLEAASMAPDHKELRPWRFFVLQGAGKTAFSDILVNAQLIREPGASPGQIDKTRTALDRAPVVVIVAVKRLEAKIPFEELFASAAAAVQNLLLAACDLGFGSMWRTGAHAMDNQVKAALGLDNGDQIVGFIYLGTAPDEARSPRSARLDDVVTWWNG